MNGWEVTVRIRFAVDDFDLIRAAAKAAGLGPEAFVRIAALGAVPVQSRWARDWIARPRSDGRAVARERRA